MSQYGCLMWVLPSSSYDKLEVFTFHKDETEGFILTIWFWFEDNLFSACLCFQQHLIIQLMHNDKQSQHIQLPKNDENKIAIILLSERGSELSFVFEVCVVFVVCVICDIW